MKKLIIIFLLTFTSFCLKAKKSPFDLNSSAGTFFGFFLLNTIATTSNTVSNLYNATLLNEYIANDGETIFKSSGATCNTNTGGGYNSCIHAGLFNRVQYRNADSCTQLSAKDSLGAFNWICEIDSATKTAQFISVGFKDGFYLSNLIDFNNNAFKSNFVTIFKDTTEVSKTDSSIWWKNSISTITNGASLPSSTNNPIYLVKSNYGGGTITLGGSKIAVIGEPNSLIVTSSAPAISASSLSHVWIEGRFQSNGTSNGVNLESLKYSVVKNLFITSSVYTVGNNSGLLIGSPFNSYFADIKVINHTGFTSISGIKIFKSNANTCRGNIVKNLLSGSNNGNNILYYFGNVGLCSNNINIGTTSMGSGPATSSIVLGVGIGTTNQSNVFINTSSFNGSGRGLYVNPDTSSMILNTFMNLLVVNNAGNGIEMNASNNPPITRFSFINIASYKNSSAGNNQVLLGGSGIDSNNFSGKFLVESTSGSCVNTNGNSAGITNAAGCNPSGVSDFSASQAITLTSADIVGQTNDTMNTNGSSTSSGIALGSISDWLNFSNIYRSWGAYSVTTIFASTHRSFCSGNCTIWDLSLKQGGNQVKGVLSIPTGNDIFRQVWEAGTQTSCLEIKGAKWENNFCSTPNTSNQTACDAIVSGDWSSFKCSTIFLRNATEILEDGIGNENGLCESSENCIYTPNIGSYQGHGELTFMQNVTNGTLSNIKLYKYSNNGY